MSQEIQQISRLNRLRPTRKESARCIELSPLTKLNPSYLCRAVEEVVALNMLDGDGGEGPMTAPQRLLENICEGCPAVRKMASTPHARNLPCHAVYAGLNGTPEDVRLEEDPQEVLYEIY